MSESVCLLLGNCNISIHLANVPGFVFMTCLYPEAQAPRSWEIYLFCSRGIPSAENGAWNITDT